MLYHFMIMFWITWTRGGGGVGGGHLEITGRLTLVSPPSAPHTSKARPRRILIADLKVFPNQAKQSRAES